MDKKYKKLEIILIAAIAILFSGIYVSADGGKGCGHHRGRYQGQGWYQKGYGGPGCVALDNLSEAEAEKLGAERTAFFESTKGLRRKIYQKRLELASELAKENPDAAVAATLQKDVSDFKAQMAQKRLEHILRVQKINPDLGRRFWGGDPMGLGMTHRGMMGPGGKGKRGAYNCPYAGYGMGSGMMGPGGGGSRGPGNCPYAGYGGGYGMGQQRMHGGGYGRGAGMMGRGGSDRDNSRQYYKGQGSQAE